MDKKGDVITKDTVVEYCSRSLPQSRENHRRKVEWAGKQAAREDARRRAVAADAAVDTAKANLAAAEDDEKLAAQQALNDAIREALDASRELTITVTEIANIEPEWLSKTLMEVLVGLPELEDPLNEGKPFGTPTPEKLELLAIKNLEAIEKAIEDESVPKPQAAK